MGDLSKKVIAMTSKQLEPCRVKYYDAAVSKKSTIDAAVVPLSAEEEDFFRAFIRAMVAVPRALDADLLGEQGMSVTEYGVLMHLSEAPDQQMRMSDLAVASSLSVSGMTRIVARLEKQDLVRRERCTTDARGWLAVLTGTGSERLAAAWPTHLTSVRRHMMDHLRGLDLKPLTAAFRRFAADVDVTEHPEQSV
jgi:DNA-binding MarR family transcriptional regulator